MGKNQRQPLFFAIIPAICGPISLKWIEIGLNFEIVGCRGIQFHIQKAKSLNNNSNRKARKKINRNLFRTIDM